MKTIRYVEIENFKAFHQKIHIDLDHPAVLIGPNNAGKTSVIQALALWSRGIKSWYEKKGQPHPKESRERISAGINRLNILDVPVSENRFFWSGTRVRKANSPIELKINVGIDFNGAIHDCRLIFIYRDTEVIYCKPCPETAKKDDLIKFASGLQFNLLYPMSGIVSGVSAETEETPLPDGRINVYLGQGQTAQVLRNICFKVVEQDKQKSSNDWQKITNIIKKLFMVELDTPVFQETRGSLLLTYRQSGVDTKLDISLAGRGLQQILLILSYLYWHKSSLLLIDEPDAHLEILRQKQIYEILKDVASENECQVVIATHSEVILDDAIETNLTLLINGESVNLASQQDMKNALRSYGIDHYYKARIHPRILYIEGSTDVEILKYFAKKIKHPAYEILFGKLNCYYTQNINPEDTLENRLDRAGGLFSNYKSHFFTLKRFVSDFQGLAIFDSDRRQEMDTSENGLITTRWKNYEIENYFITPDIILKYIDNNFPPESLFQKSFSAIMEKILDDLLLVDVFNNDKEQLEEFKTSGKGLKKTLLNKTKMSSFADSAFHRFSEETGYPTLLYKSEYYKLINLLSDDEIPNEIVEKLNLIHSTLKWES